MTRSIVTKLLVLVVFIFIICLPDFFASYGVSKVSLVCLPCERDKRARKRENWRGSAEAEVRRKTSCDPPLIPGGERWRETCDEREGDSSPTTKDARSEDPHLRWYMCETQGSATELQSNNSYSVLPQLSDLEVSVKFELGDANFLKLTLYGHSNSSSLHLQPADEETDDDGGHSAASYCCGPVHPTLETINHIVCLLRLSNDTLSSVAENKKFQKTQEDEWGAVFRILWLVLLCAVLLTLTSAFLRRMKRSGRCCRKVHLLDYGFHGQQLTGRNLHNYEPRPTWSGLTSIEEVEVADDAEIVLDGNVDHCYVTANLHHCPTVTFPHGGAEPVMDRTQL
ncbi:uncharacterized protein LOC109519828 isoform X2 [Hippocampus comes]|uniref:uncharacterized protein LOC109519828 isoform X2 n=1 Tax=Hippocampus comes TaxID=109280 RepID=UPI00094F345F|nr:PREDICTED: uncharacterized protein LOC109519828 isoform X2 [Hippocampus comes]